MAQQIGYFIEEHSPLPIADAITLLRALARAVGELHSQGRVWNLKEKDILVDDSLNVSISGSKPISVSDVSKSDERLKEVIVIDVYPPEFLMSGVHDGTGDIYSLGIFGFEMITGKSPFAGKTVHETMTLREVHNPPHPSALRGDCPEALSRIILKAMHKDPKNRYPNIGDFLRDLNQLT